MSDAAITADSYPPKPSHLEKIAISVFAILTGITVYFHEPWADEANSWLLARDASLWELWTHLMHYEGTPAIWHTLLYVLVHIHFPYEGLNYFTGLLGCCAAWWWMRRSPFPLAPRLAVPFTYYLAYQFTVVARSYCLLPLLLFLCAWIYTKRPEKSGLLTALLCVLAGVSAHGMIFSGAIWLTFQFRIWHTENRRKQILLGLIYAVLVALQAWSALPAADTNFIKDGENSPTVILNELGDTLANGFTGEWITSLLVIAASIPFLWKGRGLATFALGGAGILLFNGLVYANAWHEGMLLLIWLFALWISATKAKPGRLALAAISVTLAVQVYWAARTTYWDWTNPYSGSKAAAQYMKANGIGGKNVLAYGFACVGIQPYFPRNIFPNFRNGQPQAYFDWSDKFRNFEGGIERLQSERPEFVVLGYIDEDQHEEMRKGIDDAGYSLIETFDGSLYFHDHSIEPDVIEIYRRN